MLIWIIAAIVAFFIKGLCGFANTLVFNTILTFGTDNIYVSPVELLLGYPTNLILAVKERRSIRKNLCIPLSILVLAGSIPGVFLLKNVDATIIKIAFGIIVTLISLEMLIREFTNTRSKGSKVLLIVIGILSGILCGVYGIGALLGAYVSRITDDMGEFKANLCVVFLVENTFRILLYAWTGIFTVQAFRQFLILVPFMLLGLLGGMLCGHFLNDRIVKRIAIVLLILSGIALIVNNL